MKPTEDYLLQIEYLKDAVEQAEDEATFLRGQYNDAEEKRSKAEAEVARLEGLIEAAGGHSVYAEHGKHSKPRPVASERGSHEIGQTSGRRSG